MIVQQISAEIYPGGNNINCYNVCTQSRLFNGFGDAQI